MQNKKIELPQKKDIKILKSKSSSVKNETTISRKNIDSVVIPSHNNDDAKARNSEKEQLAVKQDKKIGIPQKKDTKAFKEKKSSIKNDKTISRKNIESIISSLRNNYNIKARNSEFEEGLNMDEVCWNNRSCQVYAKTVQIQEIHRSVDALTSSRVTPSYYQSVCSAIMIALTGKNKNLIEKQIPNFFDYASKNGRSAWRIFGIEMTISPDSSGLLGCSFYKEK